MFLYGLFNCEKAHIANKLIIKLYLIENKEVTLLV